MDLAAESSEIKSLILNSKEPLIFRKYLNWELVNWNLEKWQNLLQKENLVFRCGKKAFTKEPQWERTTGIKKATFNEFLQSAKSETNWMYFDYKYLKEWFRNTEELRKNINWGIFGFPDLTSDDSTIWIGSPGAHTPCHIDTYGCNIIAQIYGRKQWILFPPNENLKPTRVPYEESSIYSKLNFFSPTIKDFEGIENCRKVILEPGDALFVPHKWWHYVENLDLAISINVWIPLPEDNEERLKEALVQFFITQLTKNLDVNTKKVILNPNSDDEIKNLSLRSSLDLVKECKDIVLKSEKTVKSASIEFFEKYSFLREVPKISNQEFKTFLEDQTKRFSEEEEIEETNFKEIIDLINAFSAPEVISLIEKSFLENT